MTDFRKYFVSHAAALVALLAAGILWLYAGTSVAAEASLGQPLGAGISVRDQVAASELAKLKAEGVGTIVDLRPDGEAADQPPSSAIEQAARLSDIAFVYIPTPHGAISDATVDQLVQVLAKSQRPIVLYCRSGLRAARVWALAEASRTNGPSVAEILSAAAAAGRSVEDIKSLIEMRVMARSPKS